MRVDLDAVRVRGHRDVAHLCYAADVDHVRLSNVVRAPRQELGELVPRAQVLATGDCHWQRRLDLQVAFYILRVHRLLEPDQVVLLQASTYADRAGGVVRLVGIDHQLDVRPDRLAQRGDPLHVLVHR